MPKVLLVDPIHEKGQQILKEAGLTVICLEKKGESSIIEAANEAWGIIVRTSRISKDIIDHAKLLRIIGRHGAGVDNIDVTYATKQNIAVLNTPDANTLSVVEYVIGAIFATAKGFALCDREMKMGHWSFRESYRPLVIAGSTLGVIGYGRIGREVAQKALSLGMSVLVYDPYLKVNEDSHEVGSGASICCKIEEVLTNSDFLTLHVPSSPETKGLIGLEKLNMMKKQSYLINASRGGVVVEEDLYKALSGGIISGAVIDVYGNEPPSVSHPFFTLDNVILTPHNAALTESAILKAATEVAQELVVFYRGGRPQNLINPEVLDKFN